MGWSLALLGKVYTNIGKHNEVKEVLEQSLAIHKKFYPDTHIEVAWASLLLANACKELGQYEKLKALLQHCLELHTQHFGKDHSQTAEVLMSFGEVYGRENNIETAHTYFQEALKIYQKHHHFDHYKVLENLAELCLRRSNLLDNKLGMAESQNLKKQALHYFNQALEIIEKNLAADSFHNIRLQNKIKNLMKDEEDLTRS
ncbi:tetratricopeptide repeat protein [Candidatus Paracaedibacter acanthamoebae]|uniref:Uncharacterized protein n=1 Tax=Candidatus Odyssella acanthamoebae TaxID=91604 RepID=A0A077AXV1_9PROT|nr:hypothetical protein ID47_06350 [Candidatus Paracaedibacter acanthamoebae]